MIDGINLVQNENGEWEEYNNTYDVVIHCETEEEQEKAINILKSRCWIPASERLPEEKKTVLVQWEKYDKYLNQILTYFDVMWLEDLDEGIFETINGTPNGRIIAWMPLPEPYKEG